MVGANNCQRNESSVIVVPTWIVFCVGLSIIRCFDSNITVDENTLMKGLVLLSSQKLEYEPPDV